MNTPPSWLDIMTVFIGFVLGMSPWYSIPFVGSCVYTFVYGLVLYRVALRDIRNGGGVQAIPLATVIFWERAANRDPWAWIYLVSLPMAPILFLVGLFSAMKY